MIINYYHMPAFKPKATKKIVCSSKNNVTVDNKHQEMMDNFKEIESNIIPNLKKQKKEVKEKIKKETSLEVKLELQDTLKEITKKIKLEKKRKKITFCKMLNMFLIILKKRKT